MLFPGRWESHNRVHGRTSNPYDTNRIVGGSSGGEGCIQAAAASAFGLGSDIGGSIRMPSFFNGIFGHKPSKFIVSNEGQYPSTECEEQNSFLGEFFNKLFSSISFSPSILNLPSFWRVNNGSCFPFLPSTWNRKRGVSSFFPNTQIINFISPPSPQQASVQCLALPPTSNQCCASSPATT